MDNNSNNNQNPMTSLPPVEPQPQIPSETLETPPRPPIEITPEPETVPQSVSMPIEVAPEPTLPPAPEITPEPEVTPTPPTPQTEPNLSDFGITPKPVSNNNFFKIIFIFSLIIFVLVVAALAVVYFKPKNNQTPIATPTAIPTGTCALNDNYYKIGESFAAADGCNTCTCSSQNNITCTDNKCLNTTPATKSATIITPTKILIPTNTVKSSTSSTTKK